MFKIVIKTTGLTGLPQKIKRFRIGILARLSTMLAQIGQEVAAISKDSYLSGPRPDKLGRVSGDLARSVNYKVSGNRVVIGSNLKYAAIHEFGGIIRPTRAKSLVFRIGGKWFTSQKVVIPSRPFLRPAMKDAIPGARAIIQRLANEALREALA